LIEKLSNSATKGKPKLSVRQIKAARNLVGWSQSDLAIASGVSLPTIMRLEAKDGPLGGRPSTAVKLRQALESAGIEFLNGDSPGLRLSRGR
jgi:transcriptional regulator with XRE-family HTH domain